MLALRILIVSDIHGNWPALAAITEPFDLCLCLGDLVDYGPDPGSCIDWARSHADYAVRGNHDHGLIQDVEVAGTRGYPYLTRATRTGVEARLSPPQRDYLRQLPLQVRFTLNDRRFLLVHGSPRDPLDEFVPPDPQAWIPHCQDLDADVLLVGHTHVPFHHRVHHVDVVNPGSVGLPRDGDPRAGYAILDGETGAVTLRRITYPVEQTIAQVRTAPWPDQAKQMLESNLRHGRLVLPRPRMYAGSRPISTEYPTPDRRQHPDGSTA